MSRHHDEHPFTVDVGALQRNPGTRRRIELDGAIAELALSTSGVAVADGEPVRFDGVLEAVHEGILVTGTVHARWNGACRRCLERAEGELVVAVRELCVEHGDDETTYALGHEELDLEPIVHDACILELPLAPLCSEECLGLCPECGANRNVEPCGCEAATDPRWARLLLLAGGDDPSGLGRTAVQGGAGQGESGTSRAAPPRGGRLSHE